MTRYEPHCDCLGGHVSMRPDPNGRWCRADDPRAVADDPSGIVQQMPEGDLVELLASIPAGPWTANRSHPLNACTYVCAGEWNREVATLYGGFDDVKQPDEGQPWPNHPIREATARAIALLPDLLDEVIARRATEADLRAEVERLRAQAKGMTALLRAGCDLLAIESEALRNSISIIGDPDRLSDDPEDAPTIETIKEIEDWIASVKATLFPPALSPETDGGQDG